MKRRGDPSLPIFSLLLILSPLPSCEGGGEDANGVPVKAGNETGDQVGAQIGAGEEFDAEAYDEGKDGR